jgi:hypothetical protein
MAAAGSPSAALATMRECPLEWKAALERWEVLRAVCKDLLLHNATESTTSEGAEWSLEKEAEDVTVWSAPVPGMSCRRFRAVTRLPCTPSFFRDRVIAVDERLKWDPTISSYEELRPDLGGEGSGSFWRMVVNGAFGVSKRDFVDFGVVETDDSGILWSYGMSVKHDELSSGDCVRGVNFPGSGWRVLPVLNDDGACRSCECHYIVLSDLRGWLLSSVVNMAMTGQFLQFFRLARDHIRSLE